MVQTNAATAEGNSATSEGMSAQAAMLRQEVIKFKLWNGNTRLPQAAAYSYPLDAFDADGGPDGMALHGTNLWKKALPVV